MEDDDARLAGEARALFDLCEGPLEHFGRDVLLLRRIEGDREQELTAFRPFADRFSLPKRPDDVLSDKAANIVHLDMLILIGPQEVKAELVSPRRAERP